MVVRLARFLLSFPVVKILLKGSPLVLSCSRLGYGVVQIKCFLHFSRWPFSVFELRSISDVSFLKSRAFSVHSCLFIVFVVFVGMISVESSWFIIFLVSLPTPLIINNIQLSGYTTVYLSMYLLKDFLVALAIMNKAAINISVQVFEWT